MWKKRKARERGEKLTSIGNEDWSAKFENLFLFRLFSFSEGALVRLRARVMKASSFTANFVDAHDETSNNDEICGRADERTGKRSGTTPEHVQSRYEEGGRKTR